MLFERRCYELDEFPEQIYKNPKKKEKGKLQGEQRQAASFARKWKLFLLVPSAVIQLHATIYQD